MEDEEEETRQERIRGSNGLIKSGKRLDEESKGKGTHKRQRESKRKRMKTERRWIENKRRRRR